MFKKFESRICRSRIAKKFIERCLNFNGAEIDLDDKWSVHLISKSHYMYLMKCELFYRENYAIKKIQLLDIYDRKGITSKIIEHMKEEIKKKDEEIKKMKQRNNPVVARWHFFNTEVLCPECEEDAGTEQGIRYCRKCGQLLVVDERYKMNGFNTCGG